MSTLEQQFYEECKKYKYIYIYGAGKRSRLFREYLEKRNLTFDGYIVSAGTENPDTIDGVKVNDVDGFIQPEDSIIVLSIIKDGKKPYYELVEYLFQNKLRNVYTVTSKLYGEICEKLNEIKSQQFDDDQKGRWESFLEQSEKYKNIEYLPRERWHALFAEKGDENYHFRFQLIKEKLDKITSFDNLFEKLDAVSEFQQQYRQTLFIKNLPQGMNQAALTLYTAKSHVDQKKIKENIAEFAQIIQVGAALTDEEISPVKDNMGSNISARNAIYSECTALYWIYKNAPKTEYVGLQHYRRQFDIDKADLNRLRENDIDVVVTPSSFVMEGVENFFMELTPHLDFILMLEAIEKLDPAYYESAKEMMQSRFFPPCNMSIMKWDWFQKYAEFVFTVTFEIERRYDELGFMRADRYMGYVIEPLLGIFLMKHKEELKIAYADMLFIM